MFDKALISISRAPVGAVLASCISVVAFVHLNPYWLWHNETAPKVVLVLLLIAVLAWLSKVHVSLRQEVIPAAVGAVLALCYASIAGSNWKGAVAAGVIVGAFFLGRYRLWWPVYLLFRWLFILSVVPGIIYWLLYVVGISHPPELISGVITGNDMSNPAKAANGTFYYQYPGAVVLNYYIDTTIQSFYRLSAAYAEPGVVGTMAGLLLVAERFRLRNTGNILLFLAGVMSFSLAFMVIAAAWAVCHLRLRIIVGIVMCYVVIWGLSGPVGKSAVERMTIGRLVVTETGWSGYNRSTHGLNVAFSDWRDGGWRVWLFGVPNIADANLGSSGIRVLVTNGIAGIFCFGGLLLVLFYPYVLARERLFLLLLFCAVWWQRPYVIYLPYFIVITAALSGTSSESNRWIEPSRD